jgi:hypothetical protein
MIRTLRASGGNATRSAAGAQPVGKRITTPPEQGAIVLVDEQRNTNRRRRTTPNDLWKHGAPPKSASAPQVRQARLVRLVRLVRRVQRAPPAQLVRLF